MVHLVMQTVVETPQYLKDVKRAGLSEDERQAVIDFVAGHPDAGNLRRKELTMSTAGKRILKSTSQALDFVRQKKFQGKVHIPSQIDVRRIRSKASMTQSEFAEHFGVSVRTVQDWEQGRRVPVGAARAFLLVIDREPEAVHRALAIRLAS